MHEGMSDSFEGLSDRDIIGICVDTLPKFLTRQEFEEIGKKLDALDNPSEAINLMIHLVRLGRTIHISNSNADPIIYAFGKFKAEVNQANKNDEQVKRIVEFYNNSFAPRFGVMRWLPSEYAGLDKWKITI